MKELSPCSQNLQKDPPVLLGINFNLLSLSYSLHELDLAKKKIYLWDPYQYSQLSIRIF